MKVKAYIHAQYNEYEKTFSYSAHYCNMEEYGYTLLATAQSESKRVKQVIDTLLYIEHKA